MTPLQRRALESLKDGQSRTLDWIACAVIGHDDRPISPIRAGGLLGSMPKFAHRESRNDVGYYTITPAGLAALEDNHD